MEKFPDLDLILIESGGDNLAATFSPELADLTIYVIDVPWEKKFLARVAPVLQNLTSLIINKTTLLHM